MPELSLEGTEQIHLDQLCCTWKEREKAISVRGYMWITSKGEDAYLKFCSTLEKNAVSVQLKKEFGSVRCYPFGLEVVLKNGSRIIIKPKDSKLIETVAQAILKAAKETEFHAVLGENIQTLNKKRPPPLIGSMLGNLKSNDNVNKTFAKRSDKLVSNNFELESFGTSLINSTGIKSANECAIVTNKQKEDIYSNKSASEQRIQTASCDVPHGFPNTGTNCYVNAVLQCLFSMPHFIRPLQVMKEGNSSKLIKELQKLLEWRTRGSELLCAFEIISNIKTLVGFDLKKQEDAHEFLVSLFEHMGLDDNRDNCGEIWCKNFQDCFEITIEQVTRCLNCGAESIKSNTQNEILLGSVGKDNKLPVQSYLHQYFEPSTVECTCSACHHNWAELSLRIKKSPRILVLLLPRYNNVEVVLADVFIGNFLADKSDESSSKGSSKLKRLHQSPDDLDELIPQKKKKGDPENVQFLMDSNGRKDFLSETEVRPSIDLLQIGQEKGVLGRVEKRENINPENFHVENGKKQSSLHYKFVGSVSHIGKDNASGHYVSDCLHLADQFPPKWFSFNDMMVVETNFKQIAFLRSQRAYILFYVSENEFYSCLN